MLSWSRISNFPTPEASGNRTLVPKLCFLPYALHTAPQNVQREKSTGKHWRLWKCSPKFPMTENNDSHNLLARIHDSTRPSHPSRQVLLLSHRRGHWNQEEFSFLFGFMQRLTKCLTKRQSKPRPVWSPIPGAFYHSLLSFPRSKIFLFHSLQLERKVNRNLKRQL